MPEGLMAALAARVGALEDTIPQEIAQLRVREREHVRLIEALGRRLERFHQLLLGDIRLDGGVGGASDSCASDVSGSHADVSGGVGSYADVSGCHASGSYADDSGSVGSYADVSGGAGSYADVSGSHVSGGADAVSARIDVLARGLELLDGVVREKDGAHWASHKSLLARTAGLEERLRRLSTACRQALERTADLWAGFQALERTVDDEKFFGEVLRRLFIDHYWEEHGSVCSHMFVPNTGQPPRPQSADEPLPAGPVPPSSIEPAMPGGLAHTGRPPRPRQARSRGKMKGPGPAA